MHRTTPGKSSVLDLIRPLKVPPLGNQTNNLGNIPGDWPPDPTFALWAPAVGNLLVEDLLEPMIYDVGANLAVALPKGILPMPDSGRQGSRWMSFHRGGGGGVLGWFRVYKEENSLACCHLFN